MKLTHCENYIVLKVICTVLVLMLAGGLVGYIVGRHRTSMDMIRVDMQAAACAHEEAHFILSLSSSLERYTTQLTQCTHTLDVCVRHSTPADAGLSTVP